MSFKKWDRIGKVTRNGVEGFNSGFRATVVFEHFEQYWQESFFLNCMRLAVRVVLSDARYQLGTPPANALMG